MLFTTPWSQLVQLPQKACLCRREARRDWACSLGAGRMRRWEEEEELIGEVEGRWEGRREWERRLDRSAGIVRMASLDITLRDDSSGYNPLSSGLLKQITHSIEHSFANNM